MHIERLKFQERRFAEREMQNWLVANGLAANSSLGSSGTIQTGGYTYEDSAAEGLAPLTLWEAKDTMREIRKR